MDTYGYIRVSTKEQNEDRQMISMREFGVADVNTNQKKSFFAGAECHFGAISMRWVCSLDYPLLVGLKPVKS